jgi:membrane protease YdiL (CAAX protease family)
MRYIYYALVPLLVLLVALSLSAILAYLVVIGLDDSSVYRQVITRVTQLLLLLSIIPFTAYLKINKAELGYASRGVFFKQLGQGFVLGIIILIPVFIVLYFLKINVIDDTQHWTPFLLVRYMVLTLGVALLIGLVEESLFRGIVLVGLKKKLPVAIAILITSLYFAGLHFLSAKADPLIQDVTFLSGFNLLGEAFKNVIDPEHLSAFVALLMVGVFLGVLRTQVNVSLGLCIGCHTSWVWQIKMSKKLFNTDFSSPYQYWVSHYDGIVGPLVAVWLSATLIGYFIYQQTKKV